MRTWLLAQRKMDSVEHMMVPVGLTPEEEEVLVAKMEQDLLDGAPRGVFPVLAHQAKPPCALCSSPSVACRRLPRLTRAHVSLRAQSAWPRPRSSAPPTASALARTSRRSRRPSNTWRARCAPPPPPRVPLFVERARFFVGRGRQYLPGLRPGACCCTGGRVPSDHAPPLWLVLLVTVVWLHHPGH